ncbi:MAG: amino acid adenylation domain-containing protein, partial [Chloroflexota bacterium]
MKNVADIYPLSPTQAGMLFHTIAAPQSGVYFEQYTCTIKGDLDVSAFREAWEQVIGRHPILRTAFIWEGIDQPLQVVRETVKLSYSVQDWQGADEEAQRVQLTEFLAKDRRLGIDLTQAPLTRITLFQIAPEAHFMVWSFHHLVSDGWSTPLILQDVFTCYKAQHQGAVPNLPARRPYRDYIAWLKKQDSAAAEQFWRTSLAGVSSPTRLPVKAVQPEVVDGPSDYHEQMVQLAPEVTAALQSLAQQQRLTLNTIVQGAWAILLHRYSGDVDVVYGATVSGRPAELPGVDKMVGMFINTLPVRAQIDPNANLLPWLKDLQLRQLDLRQFEYSPLTDVQRWSDVPLGTSLFDSIIVFENYPMDGSSVVSTGVELAVEGVQYHEQSNYPLSIIAVPAERLTLHLIYDRAYFTDETMIRLSGHLQTILSDIAEQPLKKLADITMLTPAERHQLLVEWNDTAAEYPQDRSIHHLIEAQVVHQPQAIAVAFDDQRLTYNQLNQQAEELAQQLREIGVGPNVPVGLCLERSLEMIVAIVGVLKAGGAYLPLDPSYPIARLTYMIEDAQAPVLITSNAILQQLPELAQQTQVQSISSTNLSDSQLTIRETGLTPAAQNAIVEPSDPSNLAYIIYTSGSTGQPKGVPISHPNLVHSTTARLEYYPERIESFLLLSSFAFDSSIVGIFGTLCQGGTLVLPPQGAEQDIQSVAKLIDQHQISHVLALPSLYNLLLLYSEVHQLASLQAVMVAGEACPKNLSELHYQTIPETTLYNEYGPTEGTVWSTVYRIPADESHDQVPIGRPIANMQTYILDAQQQPLPIGIPGELYIGGAGVAQGYLNRPDLTAEKFVPHPFTDDPDARLYRTGDLASFLSDGNIEFLGRADDQVKIRGFRIEMGEIEEVLRDHPSVQQVVVIVHTSDNQPTSATKRLIAYVETKNNLIVSTADFRHFLLDKLPDYMAPAAFILLDTMPLTTNGKIDRNQLPPPELDTALETAFIAPRTPVEEALAAIWASVLGVET